MYKFYDYVQTLISNLQDTYEIKHNSLVFYKGRINRFFTDYMGETINMEKPLNAITYFDINTYINSLHCSNAEKVNHYQSLKRFFEYTYLRNITPEIISQVIKPTYVRSSKKTLSDNEYEKLRNFIVCRDNDLKERLILGLFLFTGLSRKYIANIVNSQFIYDNGLYKLVIWQDKNETILPLKAELQIIVNEYVTTLTADDKLNKVVIYAGQNYLSTYIANLTKQIIGKSHTPTTLSNTFINKALSGGNYVWEVSKLTLESISTIEPHILDSDNIINKQMSILNSF